MSTLAAPPALSFDLPLADAADPRLGTLCAVGKYWAWSQSYAPDEPTPRLLEWLDAGIADLTSAGYSLHVVRSGHRHQILGLFDFWLTADADHVWVQVPLVDRKYYVLIAGGRTGVNRQHSVAWHCQTCGEALYARALQHDGTPQGFVEAQASAVAAFNADAARRTCRACGAVHPTVVGFTAPSGDTTLAEAPAVAVAPGPEAIGVPFGAPVAHLSALPEGASTVVVGGRRMALLREGQAVYATDNACPHRAGPLGEGEVRGGTVTCPQHRFRFDLQTGVCVTNANLRVTTYRVEIADDDVIVHAPGETAG